MVLFTSPLQGLQEVNKTILHYNHQPSHKAALRRKNNQLYSDVCNDYVEDEGE